LHSPDDPSEGENTKWPPREAICFHEKAIASVEL